MSSRRLTVEIVGDAKQLEAAFGKASSSVESFGKSMTKVGKTMTTHVSLPLAAVGVAGVKMAQDFDLLISRLQGLAGVSAKQAQEWRTQILKLAPVVGKAPAELADGIYQIASAGVKGKAAFEALRVSAEASAAGMGDTATVADAVTSAMNAYAKSHLTARDAANVLTAAVRDGKGEAADFAPVIGKVVAVAAQLGVSFDQVGGALAQMTKLGVPADDAATQLSATFSSLLKTTPQAEKALEAMGLSSKGLKEELREKGLLATLETLKEKTKGSSTAMAEAFPNVRALRGILQLVGDAAQGTKQVFDDTKNSTKSLGTAFNAASQTDAFKLQKAIASLKVSAIQLGESLAPLAEKIIGDLQKISDAYQKLSPHQKAFLDKVAEFAIIAGPALIAFGKMAGAIGTLTKAYKTLFAAERLATLGLTGPTGLIAGLAAAGAAYAIYESITTKTYPNARSSGRGANSTSSGSTLYTRDGVTYEVFPGAKPGRGNPFTGRAADGSVYKAGHMVSSPIVSDGADRSNHPGVQGPGRGIAWTGDYGGLDGGFKAAVEACVSAAGGSAINVTSGRRSRAHNTAVGGAHNSNHLTGHAADGTCRINGTTYPLGDAPMNYGAHKLRAGRTFDWGGSPDIYHVDDGSNVGGAGTGDTGDSSYDPMAEANAAAAAAKAAKAKAAKRASAASSRASMETYAGSVKAVIQKAIDAPGPLTSAEKGTIAKMHDLLDQITPKTTPAQLARIKVEMNKLKVTLGKEMKSVSDSAAAAAAAFKKRFEQAMSLDATKIMRQFDEKFDLVRRNFDRETQAGLDKLAVAQTPEEKAYNDFVSKRAAEDLAKTRADQLEQASTPEEKAALALGFSLDDQEAALRQAAEDSRAAQDKKTAAAQQAYQDQRDDQWRGLSDINDDQRSLLQQSLDDWISTLEKKKGAWAGFVGWLNGQGFDTSGLVNPSTGTGGGISLPGGLSVGSGVIGHGFGGSFAAGGIVPGALGAPMLIMAHGGERVQTRAQQQDGGGVTVIVNAPNYVGDKRELMSVIRNEFKLMQNRGTKLGFN